MRFWEHDMLLYQNCVITKAVQDRGVYSPFEVGLIQGLLKRGQTFIDIGAHVGYFTLLMAKAVGKEGRGFAFEPDPRNFRLLERNVITNGYGNVRLECCAVSDRTGIGDLYLSREDTVDHHIYDAPSPFEPHGRESIAVPTFKLDHYLEEMEADPDFIKMDVQGAERLVLDGMKKTLRESGRLKHILMEFWPVGLRNAGNDPVEVLVVLRCCGFRSFQTNRKPITTKEILQKFPEDSRGFMNLWWTR